MRKFLFLSAAASILCLLQLCPINGQGFTTCIYYSNCSATTNLGVIDLNLASTTDPYSSTDTATGNNYLWKPCQDFILHGITAGAIQSPMGGYSQDLGVHSTASCTVDSNGYVMFYMLSAIYVSTGRFHRKWPSATTYVKCLCGTGNALQFVNEYPLLTYNFVFTSNACCVNFGSTSSSKYPSTPTTMTTTAAAATTTTTTLSPERTDIPASNQLVIIFFSLLVVVLICGTLFLISVNQSLKRKRSTCKYVVVYT